MENRSQARRQFESWWNGSGDLTAGEQQEFFSDSSFVPEVSISPALRETLFTLSLFRDEKRWQFLNRVCGRIEKEGIRFLSDPVDADSHEWVLRHAAIKRDIHKAHAFVRFRKTESPKGAVFTAWHRPQHFTLSSFAGLFCRRFPRSQWSIFTPDESAHWRNGILFFSPGCAQVDAAVQDDWENFWRTYYASIYNPARLMVKAMKKEMPVKYWATLPEARLIPQLIRESQPRLATMAAKSQPSAESYVPDSCQTLTELQEALRLCRGCHLSDHCSATAGSGNPKSSIMLVGEQPGDEEEKQGKPFVGPAGQVLRRAAQESGLAWESLYVTNAVKHFKYEWDGRRRLHKRPGQDEVAACRPWLQKEFKLIFPKRVVCLGSTAALSVTGRLWPVERYRGTWLSSSEPFQVLLTYHPAAILRAPPEKQKGYYRDLVDDLRKANATG